MTQYTNWKGERKPKCKRGFDTKREAQEWEHTFRQQNSGDLDMPFSAFVEIYCREQKPRLKESTWQTKENIIQQKILPYFENYKINEITTKDVRAWQNEMLAYRNEENKPYSSSYLKTLHNQLSAIFNYAVRFYDLRSNPAAKAGNMGSEERKEMLFWTKEEYQKFSEVMMDKPISYYAFQMLYWTGIREGELLALTPADFDFEKGTVKISKTYQRIKGEDMITSPKTKKSNRTVQMPDFLCTEMQEFFNMQYGLKRKDRIFNITKSYLHHEMDRGSKAAGVKRIRIHDLRHSHISLLIDMGFSAVAIADRVGHESIEITYRYETAGQPAGRQGTGRQGQYGTQGLYPWGGYVFHGGKAASWEQSSFRFFRFLLFYRGSVFLRRMGIHGSPFFQDNILRLDVPVHLCPLKGSRCHGICHRIDKFHLCVVIELF